MLGWGFVGGDGYEAWNGDKEYGDEWGGGLGVWWGESARVEVVVSGVGGVIGLGARGGGVAGVVEGDEVKE